MPLVNDITFIPNPVITGSESRYATVTVDIPRVLKSWRRSLFSFEWLSPEGEIKNPDQLSDREREKRRSVEARIETGQPLFQPVLGIGLMENVEIGSGREILLTLAAKGVSRMPVHIPASNLGDFKAFTVPVD